MMIIFPPHSAHSRIAALRQLEQENTSEAAAVAATHTQLDQANSRYQGGAAAHLEVVVAENAYLAAQLSAVDIQVRRMNASVLLIKAGWRPGRPRGARSDGPPLMQL